MNREPMNKWTYTGDKDHVSEMVEVDAIWGNCWETSIIFLNVVTVLELLSRVGGREGYEGSSKLIEVFRQFCLVAITAADENWLAHHLRTQTHIQQQDMLLQLHKHPHARP